MSSPSQNPLPFGGGQNPHAEPLGEGPRDWTLLGAIQVGVEALKAQPGPLLIGFMIVSLINMLIGQGLDSLFMPEALQELQTELDAGAQISPEEMRAKFTQSAGYLFKVIPVLIITSSYFWIGQIRAALAAARGERVRISLFFSGYDRLATGVTTSVILFGGAFVGWLALIIPGVFVLLAWSLALPLVADRRISPVAALVQSFQATQGHRIKLLAFGLAYIGTLLTGLILVSPFSPSASVYLAPMVFALVAPVFTIALVEIYMCITGNTRGESQEPS